MEMNARRKVYRQGLHGVEVPFTEVSVADPHWPVLLYDTSGPDPNPDGGLPRLRAPWIEARRARTSPGRPVTQLHAARAGELTPEMAFVAVREGVDPEVVRQEVAAGRA